MTREEAIRRLEDLQRLYLGNEKFTVDIEAIGIAIKALEQEDVLDKIRAEIEQITDTVGVSYNQYVSKIDVLQIIDKYKAEE